MKIRTILLAAAMLLLLPACNQKSDIKPTKNLIVMITDGTSTSLLSVARWYKRYINDDMSLALNVDPYICGLVQTNESNAAITCSAASMSAYMTGVRTRASHLSVYPEPSDQDFFPQDSALAWRPAATVMEATRLWQGKSSGLVATVPFCHATPAATCTHAGSRSLPRLALQMASQNLDVMFASGSKQLTPEVRSLIKASGATLLQDDAEGFRNFQGDKLWAIFNPVNMDFEIDRDPADEPSLAEMTDKAIKMLSKNKKGFFLMVEGSKVDYGAHSNDVLETVVDFFAFDEAVKVALDFAKRDGNTTIVIMPDHGNSGITLAKRSTPHYETASLDDLFGSLKYCKVSSVRLHQLLQGCKSDELASTFKEWTGISITAEEEESLRENLTVTEGNYMQVSNSWNLQRVIVSICNSRNRVGFTSGDHTSEDVFLAVYNPKDQRPEGIITNVDLNAYLRAVAGVKKPLSELGDEIFAPYDQVFDAASCTIHKDDVSPMLTVTAEGKTLRFPGWQNRVIVECENAIDTVYTRTPSVYMKQNGMFYIDRNLASLLN